MGDILWRLVTDESQIIARCNFRHDKVQARATQSHLTAIIFNLLTTINTSSIGLERFNLVLLYRKTLNSLVASISWILYLYGCKPAVRTVPCGKPPPSEHLLSQKRLKMEEKFEWKLFLCFTLCMITVYQEHILQVECLNVCFHN